MSSQPKPTMANPSLRLKLPAGFTIFISSPTPAVTRMETTKAITPGDWSLIAQKRGRTMVRANKRIMVPSEWMISLKCIGLSRPYRFFCPEKFLYCRGGRTQGKHERPIARVNLCISPGNYHPLVLDDRTDNGFRWHLQITQAFLCHRRIRFRFKLYEFSLSRTQQADGENIARADQF